MYSIDLLAPLTNAAAERLEALGYRNILTKTANGYQGWPEHAPYDGIIVTAAASHIPQPLIDQLKPGGRLVIPTGLPYSYQELMLISKDAQGDIHSHSVLGVAFVPLVDERPARAADESPD